MTYIITFLPVVLFLFVLFLFDSFKLVRFRNLAFVFLAGCSAAIVAYLVNRGIVSFFNLDFEIYSLYWGPFIEEILKITVIIILISQKKIGFMIDAAIYSFAAGAGFAVAENIYYLAVAADPDLAFWTLRGLGTAIMHSGSTSLFGIILIGALNAGKKLYTGFIAGLVIAFLIHSSYNNFYFHPILQTVLILILIPALLIIVFRFNEIQLQKWLEVEFFSEAELLAKIMKGEFSGSKSGQYLARLKEYFPAETIVDMYCYISLYLELSIKAKRNIMLAECGLDMVKEPDLDNKLKEFFQLRRSLGKSGELALSPMLKMKQRDFWKLSRL
jgi:RsiW-degrading membrane proteinase PrsW (M82 family)